MDWEKGCEEGTLLHDTMDGYARETLNVNSENNHSFVPITDSRAKTVSSFLITLRDSYREIITMAPS